VHIRDIIRDEDVGMEELCAITVSQKHFPSYLYCKGMKLEINDSTYVVSVPLSPSLSLPLLSKSIVKLSIAFSTVVSFSPRPIFPVCYTLTKSFL
jgi:hypothetical protein